MDKQTDRVRPFFCGTQYADWVTRNCEECKRGFYQNGDKLVCEVEEAITIAAISDGYVTPEIAQRMGYDDSLVLTWLTWQCAEFEACDLEVQSA